MHSWLQATVHVSWHIMAASLGVVLGAVLASHVPAAIAAQHAWVVVAAILLVVACSRRVRLLCIAALMAGVCIGVWRAGGEKLHASAYNGYYGRTVQIQGTAKEDPSLGVRGDRRLVLSDISIGGQHLPGKVWASTVHVPEIKRGDVVTLSGTLGTGFANMTGSMFRATIVTVKRPEPGDLARRLRDWFSDGVRATVADTEASLGLGFLTGQRNALPPELDEQLRITGLTHAVVASGYNLTILVTFARNILLGTSKYLATMSAAAMVGSFVLITGMSPSMSRAGLVAGICLWAWYFGRQVHPFVLLPLAAAITVLVDPSYVQGDLGWYLSFTAFAGVMIIAPLLCAYLWGREAQPPFLWRLVVETVAAQLATLPIILHAFGTYATYALCANLLVLPLVPMAMLLTFLAGIGGLIFPGVDLFGTPATTVLQYMAWVIGKIADWPGAQFTIEFATWMLVASYLTIVCFTSLLLHKTGYKFSKER